MIIVVIIKIIIKIKIKQFFFLIIIKKITTLFSEDNSGKSYFKEAFNTKHDIQLNTNKSYTCIKKTLISGCKNNVNQ